MKHNNKSQETDERNTVRYFSGKTNSNNNNEQKKEERILPIGLLCLLEKFMKQ